MLSLTTRPSKFSEVIGQDLAVLTLKKLAQTETHPVNSIVLQGAYGSGKSSSARIFAKAVNCEKFKKDGDVCNECAHCKSVNSGSTEYYRV